MEQSKITLTGSTFTDNLFIPSEVSNPVIKPTLPFMELIPGGLQPDTAVFFQGGVPINAKLFEINFYKGKYYGDGVAFHFNPQITLKYVYMNTLRNGVWEKEECVHDKPFPKGTSFSVLIIIKSEGYEVYVNGLRLYLFKHRIPLEQVTRFGVRGDVFISVCGFIKNWSRSSLCAEQSNITGLGSSFLKMLPIPSELLNIVIQPRLPYTAPIVGGVKPGMALFIQGTVNPNANQISIDLKGPNNDIPYTFNPRFGQYVYLNTCENGVWQKEFVISEKPLTRGTTFSIMILFKASCIQAFVNGSEHCWYSKLYLGRISSLSIWGDACIHYFGFAYNWTRSPFYKEQLKITYKGSSATNMFPVPAELSDVVIQPRIPHTGPIPKGLRPGMALYVRGTILKDDAEFFISFQKGQDNNSDIAFLFDPRFDEYIYLNSYINSVWQNVEYVNVKPFVRGENFIVVIVITSEAYEVYVNDTRHCIFRHRVPLNLVNTLGLWGAASVLYYGFIENWPADVRGSISTMIVTPSELSNPVIQPKIPYIAPIREEIKPGMALYVEGTIPANGNQFSINFQAGPNNGDDVPLTFNPRLGQYIYLNTCRNGKWETEQQITDKPFSKATAFNVLIVIGSQGYEMYVNGSRHCRFAHRIPFERINTLYIWGDVSVNLCGFTDNWRRSYIFRDQPKLSNVGSSFTNLIPVPSKISSPIIQPVLPYVNIIKGGLKTDMAVLFQGVLPAHAQRFEINFKTEQYTIDDDIAFHFNPRIGEYTYMNSYRNKSWEKEECVPDKPFFKGAAFQIFIVINTEGYEVYVNGIRHCMFKHRFPIEKVSKCDISGDVSFPTFSFIDNWKTLNMSQSNTTVMGSLVSRPSSLPSPLFNPFIQPSPPIMSKIKGGLRPNMAIFFQGTVPINGKSFSINFQTGESDVDDIAFHFNPRIGQYVYLNSFSSGKWENEEIVNDKPFTKGAGFYMFVVINSDNYKVFVNGLWHCTFKHRIPLEKVSTLGIRGDISKPIYGFIDNWSSSYICMDQSRITGMGSTFSSLLANPSDLSYLIIQPSLPYLAKIPGGLRPDMAVYFQGDIHAHAVTFEINFQTDLTSESDIAFHFKPRFGQDVCMNCYRNGGWDNQSETASINPFIKETSFSMFVVIKSEGFDVYVNGLFYHMFNHRLPLENICALSIYGDLSIPIYGFIDNWSKSSLIADQSKITSKGDQGLLPVPKDVSQPLIQPALPYVGWIKGSLRPDMAVFFQGTIPLHAKSFEINFKTGPCDGDDIAFHFKPLIDKYVELKSFINGSWDKKEPTPNIPFFKGTTLNMFVYITSEGYEVYVNGLLYCTFKHRIALEKVSILDIRGDIFLYICGITDDWKSCSFCPVSKPAPKDVSYMISNPIIPYTNVIPKGLKQDMALLFQGTVPADAKEFAISLKTGLSDGDNIAFHFNPRIGKYVYLNSFQNGSWEKEETAPDKPFTKGAIFQILLVLKYDGFEVYVNGVKHCVFKHRIPLEKVLILDISGDVSLPICGLIENWMTSSFASFIEKPCATPIPKEVSFPISNPTLPYVGKIPGGINQDTALFFQGTVPTDAQRFEINFKTGPSDGDDIAFQFTSHIGQYTVLNSFRNGNWDKQETTPDNPFTKGAPFQMFIVINLEGYEIYVNGLKHCTFKHRILLQKISTLAIRGDVSQILCGFVFNWKSSSFFTEIKKVIVPEIATSSKVITLQVSQAIRDPAIPYVGRIPRAMKQDMAILIQGTLSNNAEKFMINFQVGQGASDDIAFHFNPRIGRYIALNSFRNGSWEKEESAPGKPFSKGAAFQIIVVFKSDGYEVYVDGMSHCTFKHRLPLEQVSTIAIQGDVTIQLIGFIDNWKSK